MSLAKQAPKITIMKRSETIEEPVSEPSEPEKPTDPQEKFVRFVGKYLSEERVTPPVITSEYSEYSGVRFTTENKNADTLGRVLMSTPRGNQRFEFPGAITHNGAVISVPMRPPLNSYKTSALYKCVGNPHSTIIRADDGTTVTLYFYDGSWRISTFKSYEMNEVSWMGDRTYQEVLNECLDEYKDFSYDKLDIGTCYTIGFKHSAYHPFCDENPPIADKSVKPVKHTIKRAWFVRSVNLAEFNNGYPLYANIGLPLQEHINIKAWRGNTVRLMFDQARDAYPNYLADGRIHYGFVVRLGHTQMLVESSLLRNIRQLFYNNVFNRIDKAEFNRRKYIAVHSFLHPKNHDIFNAMFPNNVFKKAEAVVAKLVDAVMKIVKTPTPFDAHTDIDIAALCIHINMSKKMTLGRLEAPEETRYQIFRYILNPNSTELIYKLLYKSKK